MLQVTLFQRWHAALRHPATIWFSINRWKRAWPIRQVIKNPAYRLTHIYNWALGLTCGLAIFFGKLLWLKWVAPIAPALSYVLHGGLLEYIQSLVVANAVVLGAIIVRKPESADESCLIQELADRALIHGQCAITIQPLHGAFLVARVTWIAPVMMLLGLSIPEPPSRRLGVLLCIGCLMFLSVLALASSAGALAVVIRKKVSTHAVWVWLGLWTLPELIRTLLPAAPTLRSLIETTLGWASCHWGLP